MALAVVAKFPVSGEYLFHNQITLADKMASGLPTSLVEQRFHTLFLQAASYREFYEGKVARVHTAFDGTKIYDATRAAAIRVGTSVRPEIFFHGCPIRALQPNGNIDRIEFSKRTGTDYVVIEESTDDLITVQEVKLNPEQEARRFEADVSFIASFYVLEQAVASMPLPEPYMDHPLINKLVSGSSLTPEEWRMHSQLKQSDRSYQASHQAKLARVHCYKDNQAKLFDCTNLGVASVEWIDSKQWLVVAGTPISFPDSEWELFAENTVDRDGPSSNYFYIEKHSMNNPIITYQIEVKTVN